MTAVDVVRRFRGLRALVIGDAMLDSYLEGTAARLCSEGPVPVVRKTAEERAPGGAANAAANLRALGAEVLFLGVVGADPAGSLLRSALRERGVVSVTGGVGPENAAARRFYENAGFKTVELRLVADADVLVRNFLRLVADKGRSGQIEEIAREFDRLMAREERRLNVELTTARELSDEEARDLLEQIEHASGRRIEATRSVDPNLIGGFVLQAGSMRVDASVRGRLDGLRQELVKGR